MKISLNELKAIIEEELSLYLAEKKMASAKSSKSGNKNAMGSEKLKGKPLNKSDEKDDGKLANVAKHNKEFGTGFQKASGKASAKGLAGQAGTPGKEGTKGKAGTPKNSPPQPKPAKKTSGK